MPPPNCKKQVQSFIGMVNYMSKFSACLSELAEPIQELSKEKVPFNQGPEHEESSKFVKREIANAPILAHYNPRKPMVLHTDVSIKGTWTLLATRWETCLLCKQDPDRSTKKLCSDWTGILGRSLGHEEVSPLSLCQPFHTWNRPEAVWNHSIQKLGPSNSTFAKDTDKNISIHHYSQVPSWT